jgi:ABC-type Fe3+-siderophore transport system permease subunit
MNLPAWPKVETIKAFATYGIAAYIVLSVLSPETFGIAAIGIIGGTVVGVTSFLFGVEQGKQQQKAFEAGVNTTPTGGTTVNASGDTTVQGGDPTIVQKTTPAGE